MKLSLLTLVTLVGMLYAPQISSAVVITFDSPSDYDTNFYERSNPGLVAVSGTSVLKTNTAASSVIYRPGSTNSGTQGSGGDTPAATPTNFGDVQVRTAFSVNELNSGLSLGVYTGLNSAGSGGYLAIFRFTDGANADLRIYEGANANDAGIGTLIATRSFGVAGTSFSTNTFYTLELNVQQLAADNLQFTASIFNASNAQLGNTITFTDTTPTATQGQVGLRLSTNNGANANATARFDNFEVNAIPEPGSAMLLGLAALALGLRRRARA